MRPQDEADQAVFFFLGHFFFFDLLQSLMARACYDFRVAKRQSSAALNRVQIRR